MGTFTSKHIITLFGHKFSFIILQVCFAASLLVLPFFQHQYFWLLDRLVGGLLVGGTFVVIESWMLKGSSEGRRKRLSVYMGMLYGGTALGQFALSLFGTNGVTPFMLSAVLAVISAILLAILPEYISESNPPEFTVQSQPGIRWVKIPALIGCLVSGVLLGTIFGMMPLEFDRLGMSQAQVGSLMAIITIGAMVVQPVISLLSKKVARTLLMSFFALLGAMSIGIFEQVQSGLSICMFILGMSVFSFYPIAINLGSSSVPEEHMVGASQQMLLTYSAGSVLGPIIAQHFMMAKSGLFGFFFVALTTACLYMLLVSLKGSYRIAIHK